MEKRIIGRSDKVDLPDLGIFNVKAKIDTGAYTSSIHCKKINVDEETLSFYLSTEVDEKSVVKKFQTRSFTQKTIRSSNGATEVRYIIKTHIFLFDKRYLASFSLTDRSMMKNPVLLGRKLLKDRFMVDVSKKNLSHEFMKANP